MGEWRIIQDEEFYHLYFSPDAIQVIKSRQMRWGGHVVHTEGRRIQDFCWKT
jgi:hypothetical protein